MFARVGANLVFALADLQPTGEGKHKVCPYNPRPRYGYNDGSMDKAPPDIPESEPEVPYPRRFWWLKRLGLSVLLLIAALLLARAIAVHRAQAAYDAEIASLRARGEPVTLEDLKQPPIPDEQNAISAS